MLLASQFHFGSPNQTNTGTHMENEILSQLRSAVGPDNASTDPIDLTTYGYDATRRSAECDAVVWPTNMEQISELMRLATQHRIPIVPRGSGSGLSGGTLPVRGGWMMSLERMNRILDIDTTNRTVTAEPGIRLNDLKAAVEKEGLFYPPDPASAKIASLGGTIAECSGGLNCVKYGTTRDWVMEVRAVLPTGEIVRFGSRARKCVSGYNVLQLLIGSEGTLATVGEATLRLIPHPRFRRTFMAGFESHARASEGVLQLLNGAVTPCALEYIDRNSIECVREHLSTDGLPAVDALLLGEVDGFSDEQVDADLDAVVQTLRDAHAESVVSASDEREREDLWHIRRNLRPAMFEKGRIKVNEDIAVPLDQFPDMLHDAYEIAERHKVTVICFGHAGDGNVHVNLMSDIEHDPAVIAATREVFERAVARGGTISGEHGIGTMKAEFMALEWGAAELGMLRKIKSAFDPADILNPGKIWPPDSLSQA